jgi:ABC-type glutathione transport system ATPase component
MILKVENLSKTFLLKGKEIHALRSVSFSLEAGKTLALVGESGCGKSTLARTLIGIHEPSAGKIFFNDQEVTKETRKTVCRNMQMIFQDPFASLNPRMTIEAILSEPLEIHRQQNRSLRVAELLDLVRLPQSCKQRFPHEFSGGQRQRIAIARALALNPQLLICDEPTAALDVSIQAQIVNLLLQLQNELNLSYLFITHNHAIAHILGNQIAVMHEGRLRAKEQSPFAIP